MKTQPAYSLIKRLLRLQPAVLTAALCAAWLASPVSAQEMLVRYNLTTGSDETRPATTVATGITAGDLMRGPGIRSASLARGYSANTWVNDNNYPAELGGPMEPTRQNALDFDNYFELSFTVEPGFTVSLSTLDHAMRRSSDPAASFFEWQYSFDGFATPGITLTPQGAQWDSFGWTEDFFRYLGRGNGSGTPENFNYMTSSTGGQGDGNQMPTFDLTGFADLQNIEGGTTVTFRLYGWGQDQNSRTVALGRDRDNEFGGPAFGGTIVPSSASATRIYWTENSNWPGVAGQGLIRSMNLDDGETQTVVEDLNRPIGIAIDAAAGHIYWAEGGTGNPPDDNSRIGRANLDGSDKTVLYEVSGDSAQKIAVVGDTLYWTNVEGGVVKAPKDGSGTPETLGGSANLYTAIDVHVVGNHIFYGEPATGVRGIYRMNLDGADDQLVAANAGAMDWGFNTLAIDQDTGHIYYGDWEGDITGAHTIKRRDHDGSNPVTIAEQTWQVSGIVLFDGRIYWAGRDGNGAILGRVGMDGSNPTILASHLPASQFGIAILPYGQSNVPFVTGFGSAPGSQEPTFGRFPLEDWSLDWNLEDFDFNWQTSTGAEADPHTSRMMTQVINLDPENGFKLSATVRIPRLQNEGDNAYGLALLGEREHSIRAEWLPRQSGGGSTIRFVNTQTGGVLEQEAWTGLTPTRINNNVGLSDGSEAIFQVGAPYFAGDTLFHDDFQDTAASEAAWSHGNDESGSTVFWEAGTPASGPGAAKAGDHVFGTRLSGGFTQHVDAWLRTPAIDLSGASGATLTFWEYLDIDTDIDFHHATVRVLDAGTLNEIEVLSTKAGQPDGTPLDWEFQTLPLPQNALGGEVIIEFRLVTDDFIQVDGWYIDDVTLEVSEGDHTIVKIPAKIAPQGTLPGIRTAAGDIGDDSADYLQFTVVDNAPADGNDGVTVYVAWDARNAGLEPDWLTSDFTRTDHFVRVSGAAGHHRLWAREYAHNALVTLGGASAAGGGPFPPGTDNYFVLLGDARPGLDTHYTLEAAGILESGQWNLSFTLTDANDFSETIQITVAESLVAGRNAFGVVVRHPNATDGPLLHAPIWETASLSMEAFLAPDPPTFDTWREAHFTTAQLADPAISGAGAAPAGDGVANLLKYALDLHPWTPVSSRDLPQADIDELGRLVLIYWERTDIDDIDYIPEVSENLTIWNSGPGFVTEFFRESAGDNIEEVGVRGDAQGDLRGFIQLRVEKK